MMKYGCYLVCHEHIDEVSDFLTMFFPCVENQYTHKEWITFVIPHADFLLNLMKGDSQKLTQDVTMEIYFDTMNELVSFSNRYGVEIKSFKATKSTGKYTYHYCEVAGPHDICKIEASYSKNI